MAEAKQAKLEDSNVAGIGSDLDQQLRKAAAMAEEEFKGAGQTEGIEIWRVEQLAIKRWPTEEYGQFYQGDSYIVLRTYRNEEGELRWDVHFWLGADTSIDERGVAAYKTVELDDLLGTLPVQHREVQGHESELFLSYFRPSIRIMQGGIESGFNHVEPASYKPRLLQMKGKKNVRVFEVPLACASLNAGDVFVLDNGLELFQWNAPESSGFERRKAGEIVSSIKSERSGKPSLTVLDGDEDNATFWSLLGGKGAIAPASPDTEAEEKKALDNHQNKLFRLTDASGSLEFKLEAEGSLNRGMIDDNDVFILDLGFEVFVHVGRGASKVEKAKAILCVEDYLQQHNRPAHTPVTRIVQGADEPQQFKLALQ